MLRKKNYNYNKGSLLIQYKVYITPLIYIWYLYNLKHTEKKYYYDCNKGSLLIRYKLKYAEKKYYYDYNKGSLLITCWEKLLQWVQ